MTPDAVYPADGESAVTSTGAARDAAVLGVAGPQSAQPHIGGGGGQRSSRSARRAEDVGVVQLCCAAPRRVLEREAEQHVARVGVGEHRPGRRGDAARDAVREQFPRVPRPLGRGPHPAVDERSVRGEPARRIAELLESGRLGARDPRHVVADGVVQRHDAVVGQAVQHVAGHGPGDRAGLERRRGGNLPGHPVPMCRPPPATCPTRAPTRRRPRRWLRMPPRPARLPVQVRLRLGRRRASHLPRQGQGARGLRGARGEQGGDRQRAGDGNGTPAAVQTPHSHPPRFSFSVDHNPGGAERGGTRARRSDH